MIFKLLTTNEAGKTIYGRIDADGNCRLTCTADYPEFAEWLAEGNTPLPADAMPTVDPRLQMQLTPTQLRLKLLALGLLDDVEEAVKNNRELGIWWEYSTVIERLNPLVIQVATMLGKDEEWLDGFFS
jgi:hypothetical protein